MKTCSHCNKELNSEEALQMHTKYKHPDVYKEPTFTFKQKQKIKNWSITLGILALLIAGIAYVITGAKTLPPTEMQGHVEQKPPFHKLKTSMSIPVQKHMLEHSDGTGPPGIIINYNCNDYTCEAELIEKLEVFADEFSHVYVAPFPKMDAKIALTKMGGIQTLDDYDEEVIRSFIKFS